MIPYGMATGTYFAGILIDPSEDGNVSNNETDLWDAQPVTVTACSTDDHTCDQYTKCSIRDPLWKIKNRILDALNTVSVAEMAVESTEPVPAPSTVSRMMFVPSIGE